MQMTFEDMARLEKEIEEYFKTHGKSDVFKHSKEVAELAQELAVRFNEDPLKAYICGLIHDLGQTVPQDKASEFCSQRGIGVLKEEQSHPGILHQKISPQLAEVHFGIEDRAILNAIEVHTTLKKEADPLTLVLFLADKLSWSTDDKAPFEKPMKNELNRSLERGAKIYLEFLFSDTSQMAVVHPWAVEALDDLRERTC